jgi:hypothetical protein
VVQIVSVRELPETAGIAAFAGVVLYRMAGGHHQGLRRSPGTGFVRRRP